VFFGDYTNITAHDGQVRPIWTRLQGGQLSLWTAIMDVTVGTEDVAESIPFTLEQNYPNPFRETTRFSYKLIKPSEITLVVYDMYGRPVATLKEQTEALPGKYIQTFDPRQYGLSSGVYYFMLKTQDRMQKRQMIFVE